MLKVFLLHYENALTKENVGWEARAIFHKNSSKQRLRVNIYGRSIENVASRVCQKVTSRESECVKCYPIMLIFFFKNLIDFILQFKCNYIYLNIYFILYHMINGYIRVKYVNRDC